MHIVVESFFMFMIAAAVQEDNKRSLVRDDGIKNRRKQAIIRMERGVFLVTNLVQL
jgi:hypothetical protein